MKRITKLSALSMLLVIGSIAIQCQHEDEAIIPVKGPDPIEHGTEIIVCPNCTPLVENGAPSDFSSTNVPAGTWYHDKAHSNVMWETQYKQFGSLLTGRFNYFVLKNLNFDEGVPTNISFEGYVRLNSVNTGEPSRDGGCLAGNGATSTFKTTLAMTTEPENKATLKSKVGSGRYSTTDDGFLVDAEFIFLGITKDVTVKMKFYPKTDIGTAYMAGVYAEFDFNALADFLPGNTNIGDIVKVRIDNLLRNKK